MKCPFGPILGQFWILSLGELLSHAFPDLPKPLAQLEQRDCPKHDSSPWCPCYQYEEGVFLECPNTGIHEIRSTLSLISAPVKSLGIYHLDENVTALPPRAFGNASLSHLLMSYTSLESVDELAFEGLEASLESLSLVNSRLKEVPQKALSELKALASVDFDSNEIRKVESYAFYGLPLTTVNLQSNRIESLSEYAFGGLENTLQELILINNRLSLFPLGALRRLRKLKTLKLVKNFIDDVPDDGFTRFTDLRTLDLTSNRLRTLRERTFVTMPRLSVLSLQSNRLSALEDQVFMHLVELENLDLSHNRLEQLNARVLSPLRKLRTVDLSFNHLHSIEVFKNLTQLREVFLSNNNILQITNDTLHDCMHVSALFLHNNAIADVESGSFHALRNLHQLQLSFNRLREIHPSLFKNNRELRSLSMDNNLVTDIQPGTFQELVELRDLRLQNNLLKRIRKGSFYSLPNLQELHLQSNRIEAIEKEALKSLANLQHLNVQGNRLIEMGDVLSRFPSTLRSLQINHNEMVLVSGLEGLNKMEILWLDHNKIKELQRESFQDLTEVQTIYLDHNAISAIEDDTFSRMTRLHSLNLDSNNLDHLGANLLSSVSSLEELYLSDNKIMDIEPLAFKDLRDLRVLQLSRNQIYVVRKYMFEGLEHLEELDLSNSMIESIEDDTFNHLTGLARLDLSWNRLKTVKITFLGNLRHLDLSFNNQTDGIELQGLSGLTHLNLDFVGPDKVHGFESLRDLRYLRLCGNGIKQLDSKLFSGFASLTELLLDRNELSSVPKTAIRKLPKLEVLSMAGNRLKVSPNMAFSDNANLRTLNLSGNGLTAVEKRAFHNLSALIDLDLSHNSLTVLPAFDTLASVESIRLDHNRFSFVPNSVLALPRLRGLNIDANALSRIGEDMGSSGEMIGVRELNATENNVTMITSHDFAAFPDLTSLSLRRNRVAKVSPGAFKPLGQLVSLDLGQNELDILPEERLSGLRSLEVLNLTDNRLLEFPVVQEDMRHLQKLDLSINRLSKIEGDTFDAIYHLRWLDLSSNRIAWISPAAFANLSHLEELNVAGNAITRLTSSVLAPIEVTLVALTIEGNPFHCDCFLLSLWEFLQDHPRLVAEAPACGHPASLEHRSLLTMHPSDMCPAPLLADLSVKRLDSDRLTVGWTVQNGTLIGGFTVTHHAAPRSPVTLAHVPATARDHELEGLVPEAWYTVCVTATGKYLRVYDGGNRPIPYVTADKEKPQQPEANNRKCLQIRTLARTDKTRVTLSTLGIILGSGISAALVLTLSILLTALKFRRRRRRPVKNDVPQEYVTYRHFSIEGVYS